VSERKVYVCDGCAKEGKPRASYSLPDGWDWVSWSWEGPNQHACSPACTVKVLRAEADRIERAPKPAAKIPPPPPWPAGFGGPA
jgi:hypothetical protein